jgi:prepilin-type N-terminal cleavage/methylation domain-containing protein
MNLRREHYGFTLIELLVVVSIIGMLSSVVLASVNNVRIRSRDGVRLSDFRQFGQALELYYSTYNMYPCGDNNNTGGDVTLDSTLSTTFLDGISDEYPREWFSNCIGEPHKGIYTAGFYPVVSPQDPINYGEGGASDKNYAYGYEATLNRQLYILYGRLENNSALMGNDSGYCALLYEVGPGVGIIPPQMGDYVGNGCN